ncbi:MAG: helix-turn-helix domain-containing protein [Crocinitomicaceae bacterium]
MEIQAKFLSELANKLGSKKKVAKAIMDTLEISQDSCYRRTRGETQFSIEEIQKLCLRYHISFDTLIGAPDKNQIFFTKDLTEIDL